VRVIPAAWGYTSQKLPPPDLKGKIRLRPSLIQVKGNKDSSFIIESTSVYENLKLSEVAYLKMLKLPNQNSTIASSKNANFFKLIFSTVNFITAYLKIVIWVQFQ